METTFYTFPQTHAGFAVGDLVAYRNGNGTVYTVEQIQIRTSDGSALFRMRSAKTRQTEREASKLQKVEG